MWQYKTCLWVSGLITIGMLIASWVMYPELPEIIVTHYNLLGEADGWGSKSTIFWIVGLQTLQYISLAILSCYPQIHNYPVIVTDENRGALYWESRLLSVRLLLIMSFIFLLLFEPVTEIIGSGFLLVLLVFALLLMMVGIFVSYFRRVKKLA